MKKARKFLLSRPFRLGYTGTVIAMTATAIALFAYGTLSGTEPWKWVITAAMGTIIVNASGGEAVHLARRRGGGTWPTGNIGMGNIGMGNIGMGNIGMGNIGMGTLAAGVIMIVLSQNGPITYAGAAAMMAGLAAIMAGLVTVAMDAARGMTQEGENKE